MTQQVGRLLKARGQGLGQGPRQASPQCHTLSLAKASDLRDFGADHLGSHLTFATQCLAILSLSYPHLYNGPPRPVRRLQGMLLTIYYMISLSFSEGKILCSQPATAKERLRLNDLPNIRQ